MLGKFDVDIGLVQRWSRGQSSESQVQGWVLVADMEGLRKEAALNCLVP